MQPSFNVCPTDPVDTLVAHEGNRELVQMRWGLVPYWWSKPLKELRLATFNARIETVTKPFFREPFRHRRCLIPVSGYYPILCTRVPYLKAISARRTRLFCAGGRRQTDRIEDAVDALGMNGLGLTGRCCPAASWSGRLQCKRDETERLGLRAARGERDANAAGGLGDAAGDLQQMQTDRGELGVPQRVPTRDCSTQVE